MILAIIGVILLPLVLKFIGLVTVTERLVAILAVADSSCDRRRGSGFHLPLWPEPTRCSMALG